MFGGNKLVTVIIPVVFAVSHPASITDRLMTLSPVIFHVTVYGPSPLPVTDEGLSKSQINSALGLALPVKVTTADVPLHRSVTWSIAATGEGIISTIKQVDGPSPHSFSANTQT